MLALDFINIGNGDCILIREMEGTRQKFAMMVDCPKENGGGACAASFAPIKQVSNR